MITITESAAAKSKELMPPDDTEYALRMRVVGGGCSGFQYQMEVEEKPGDNDKVFSIGGINVFIDKKSAVYLAGVEIDYLNSQYRRQIGKGMGDTWNAITVQNQ